LKSSPERWMLLPTPELAKLYSFGLAFKSAMNSATLCAGNPHSFRKTLVQLGERLCQTPEQFKAWSQNLGHEKVLTTFSSYGEVGRERQREIIHGLSQPDADNMELEKIVNELIRVTRRTAA